MISDPMNQAIEEAVTGKVEDHNGVYFFHNYFMKPDESANNIPGSGYWQPCILIRSPGQKNQEVRRKVSEGDKQKYQAKYQSFLAQAAAELAAKEAYLAEQLASLRKLIGNGAAPPKAKRAYRRKIPQAAHEQLSV